MTCLPSILAGQSPACGSWPARRATATIPRPTPRWAPPRSTRNRRPAPPSTTGLLGGGLVNQPPAGADATITLLENSPYTFGAADFGFSDADSYSLSPTQTTDGPAAGNVLVLYNTASAAGIEIANYYAQVHPGVHLLGINGIDPNNEDITADAYLSTIRPQVMAALTSSIDVIVTTKGLPLRIQVTEAALPLGSTYVDGQGTTRTDLRLEAILEPGKRTGASRLDQQLAIHG